MRKRRELFRRILEDEILFIFDYRGRIIDATRTALEVFGYEKRDLGRLSIRDVVVGDTVKVIEEIVGTGESERIPEVLCKTKSGERVWLEVRLKPIHRGGRKLLVGVARDITKRKELERKLKESEEMFRVMAERSLVGIYMIQDGVFVYVNPKMAELWGYKVEEIVGKPPMEFVHPEDREMVRRNIELRISGKMEFANYRVRIVRKDGEIRINEVYGSRMTFRGKPAIIGTLVDVTESVRMQKEVERLNKLLKILNEVGQLIARERDIDMLIDRAVEKLSRFYHLAAICFGEKIRCHATPDRKLPDYVYDLPHDVMLEIRDGPLYTLLIPMVYEDEVFGRIILQSESEFSNEERELLRTLDEDLAFAVKAAKTEEEK